MMTFPLRRLSAWFGPLLPIAVFFLSAIVFLTMSRLLLVIWQWHRVGAVDGFWHVFGYGLRMDVMVLCYLLFFPAIVAVLLPLRGLIGTAWRHLSVALLTLIAAILVFMELATPSYVNEYGVRPSQFFVEYIVYPHEVFSTLWAAYKLPIFIAVVIVTGTVVQVWRQGHRLARTAGDWRWWQRVLVLPLVILVMFIGARSSFGHRAANASLAAFSSDPLVNDLTLSSTYTVLNAANALRDDADASSFYGKMPSNEIIERVRADMNVPASDFINPQVPTLHRQLAAHPAKRPANLVILLEESMGAQFIGALGGLPLSPELDRLAREGWWFTNLYATGTRSVRGLEAVVAGFPPTPALSVLKLAKSQDGFYTLARTLAGHGYSTTFIYGGESHFDNMGGFFLRNGFEHVIDERDYPNPSFRGSWGVSDEDLFDRAHETFLAQGDKPFFALVFSSSFHSPFEFPDGRIELYEQPKETDHNAVKYADYALGQFFKKAKQAPYWNNTVFLVVADHDARVYGASLVPIEHFHIPGLIIGKSIQPRQYEKPASQIDLAPTLLSLIGLDTVQPMIGHDLTRLPADYPGRAIMQYENNNAYMKGDRVVIYEPHKPAKQFRYRDGKLEPVEPIDQAFARDAQAHALWPSLAYRERKYRLPKTVPGSGIVGTNR
jgi:phosphoglycerol transferase MdoB-like AlkP superfamily enzyme